jgi:hypothetical protein
MSSEATTTLDMSQLPPEVQRQIAAMQQSATSGQNQHTSISAVSGANNKKSGGRNYKYDVLKTELMALYGGIGMVVAGFNEADGLSIVAATEGITDAWITLAKGNDGVYKVLKSICATSAIGTVVMLHVALLNTILANHGVSMGSLLKRKQEQQEDAKPDVQPVPGFYVA